MNRIKTYLNGLGRGTRTVILALAVIFVSAGVAQATSISTNITTVALTATGALSVTGLATLSGGATTTQLTLLSGDTIKNTTASTTVLSGTISVSTTTTTGLTASGASTLASTTATAFKVGQVGSQLSVVTAGYCVATADMSTASTTGVYADCTPYRNVAGVPTQINTLTAGTDRVFVQATSSLPSWIVLQAASTTAGSLINVKLVNVSTTTSTASATYAFNFWAFQ